MLFSWGKINSMTISLTLMDHYVSFYSDNYVHQTDLFSQIKFGFMMLQNRITLIFANFREFTSLEELSLTQNTFLVVILVKNVIKLMMFTKSTLAFCVIYACTKSVGNVAITES